MHAMKSEDLFAQDDWEASCSSDLYVLPGDCHEVQLLKDLANLLQAQPKPRLD